MDTATISPQNQFGDYWITIGARMFVANFDGKFHRCGAMRAKTSEALVALIQKTVR